MPKAIWNGHVIAESDETQVVEGNHYFPANSIQQSFFKSSEHTSFCGWKGTANYYHLVVDGERNDDAAWCYKDPKPEAQGIAGHFAFWKGVEIS